ncbi:hypothetical protein KI387_023832, partial [Taxus chinensis]
MLQLIPELGMSLKHWKGQRASLLFDSALGEPGRQYFLDLDMKLEYDGIQISVRVGLNAEKSGDVGRVMIVAVTDGRANISLKRSTDPYSSATSDAPKPSSQELKEEILEIAGKIYKAGMSLLVIDTENKFISTGFAKEIARVAQ